MKNSGLIFLAILLALSANSGAQQASRPLHQSPLQLLAAIPLPGLHDGDFDHFAIDLDGHRLFLTAEENTAVEVFDTQTNKLIHTITDVKASHSLVYRGNLKKLFVVDGDAAELKIYETDAYKPVGKVQLAEDADSMGYDSAGKYMYIVNGGRGAHTPYSLITIVDTTSAKKLGDIKVNSDRVEALAIEKNGSRIFCNITGQNAVGVIDRDKRSVIAIWSSADVAKQYVAMAFDEANHRLLVVTRMPGKLIVLDSDSGKIVTSLPSVGLVDDAVYDAANKRIYAAGDQFVDVFEQKDADHYLHVGRVPGSFRAKTALLVPELNRYYLAVPHHASNGAEVYVHNVIP